MHADPSLIVATHSRPLFLLFRRAVCDDSVVMQQTELDPAGIVQLVNNSGGSAQVIVVDGMQREQAALTAINILKQRGCVARIIMVGSRIDSDVLVEAARQGAWDYLVPHATLEEISQATVGAIQGVRPSIRTTFGRVRACTAATRTQDGHYILEDGSALAAQDFSRLCETHGITVGQVAGVAVGGSGIEGAGGRGLGGPPRRRTDKQQLGGGAERGSVVDQADAIKPMSARRRLVATAVALVIMLATATYYRIGRVRGTVAVQGSLSFDGQPLERGSILFYPIKSTNSRVSAVIREGRFRTELEPGLKRGESYIVRVYAYRTSSTQQEQVDDVTKVYAQEQFIPLQFNRESGIQVDVTPSIVASGVVLDLRQGK